MGLLEGCLLKSVLVKLAFCIARNLLSISALNCEHTKVFDRNLRAQTIFAAVRVGTHVLSLLCQAKYNDNCFIAQLYNCQSSVLKIVR